MSAHFTAVVTISQTGGESPALALDRRVSAVAKPPARDVVEVAKVVVRAATLDELRVKVSAHVALI